MMNLYKSFFKYIDAEHLKRIKNHVKDMGFILDNPDDVIKFIDKHPKIMKILEESKDQISKYFDDFNLHLGYYMDPEESYDLLNLIILTDISDKQSIKQMGKKESQLFDAWFKDHYKSLDGKMTIRVYPRNDVC